MYSLGSGTDRGILGVSPWNAFYPCQNLTRLIRAFVFSEPPTFVMSRDIVGRCVGLSLIFKKSPAVGRALLFVWASNLLSG